MTERLLYFDTETGGIPLWKEPSLDPRQPHIVQLAAYLEVDGSKAGSMDVIIRPEFWQIDPDAEKQHGISFERATAVGIREETAILTFMELVENCDMVIGHNVSFDKRMVRIALQQLGERLNRTQFYGDLAQRLKDKESFCTMYKSTHICQIPPTDKMMGTGRKTYKNPSLEESYEFFKGQPMKGAHNAMHDVMATIFVHRKILAWHADNGSTAADLPEPPTPQNEQDRRSTMDMFQRQKDGDDRPIEDRPAE